MSEYWKSTPKYWCKHCSTYVRDTGLERRNHESTAKHQGALKRFLRDIHRDHEKEEREKDRAKREVERLNGVVGGAGTGSKGASTSAAPQPSSSSTSSSGPATQEQRQKQWEQLADMGIDVPTELRPDMAMAGTWTVTNTRVIDAGNRSDEDSKPGNIDAVANGTRKRVKPEENEEDERRQEEEKAVQGLFKKPRRWGRDTREAPGDDAELDALLSGSLVPKAVQSEVDAKAANIGTEQVKNEGKDDEPSLPSVKNEEPDVPQALENVPSVTDDAASAVKKEDLPEAPAEADVPVVMFKKRKGKDNVRQKKPIKS